MFFLSFKIYHLKFIIVKKGFTLVETLLVIVVITILMTITMHFWSKRIDELKYQSNKEKFITAYERLYAQNMTSNYYEGVRYDQLDIAINLSGWIGINFIRSNEGSISPFYEPSDIILKDIFIDSWSINTQILLSLKPYVLGCSLMGFVGDEYEQNALTWSRITFTMIIGGRKSYCFSINNDTCKLIEQKCE